MPPGWWQMRKGHWIVYRAVLVSLNNKGDSSLCCYPLCHLQGAFFGENFSYWTGGWRLKILGEMKDWIIEQHLRIVLNSLSSRKDERARAIFGRAI